ncbi:MAG: hypothetical protein J6E29_06795 [Prevotella sp.]|nr:hypothetical protein [Prevotella sp.]
MKRLFLFIFIFTAICMGVSAQGNSESPATQAFQFVYVAQDHSMNVQTLTEQLRDDFNHAIMDGPTIFYISRGTTPLIVKVNFPDDNRGIFEDQVLAKVREQESHSVDGSFDKRQIRRLLQENNFVDGSGHLMYKRTDFKFYVGQSFWTMGNHEAVIAPIYFELDLRNFITYESFNFNVYCPKNMDVDSKSPFGILNPDGINDDVRINKIL